MKNVIHFTFPQLKDIKTLPSRQVEQRQLARYLLMRLNPAREGDLATILNTNKPTDQAAVIEWLEHNQRGMNSEECVNKLRCQLLDQLSEH